MSKQAERNRRQELREQQLAAARKAQQRRRIQIGSGIVAAIVVIGLIAWAVASGGASNAGQVTPPNANSDRTGIAVKLGDAPATAPLVKVYQDYQCPFCQKFDGVFGARLNELTTKGLIRLEYHTMTFLDTNLRNDASERSGVAAACADTVGAYNAYHEAIYANQPQEEGVGYTDDQLRVEFAGLAGITGDKLTSFQSCFDSRATKNFVKGTNEAAFRAGVTSTPTYVLVDAANPKGKDITKELSLADAFSLDRALGTLGK